MLTGVVNAADKHAKITTMTAFEPATHKRQSSSMKSFPGAVSVYSRRLLESWTSGKGLDVVKP